MPHFTEEQQRMLGATFGVAIGSLLDVGFTPAQIISVFRPEVAKQVIKILDKQEKA